MVWEGTAALVSTKGPSRSLNRRRAAYLPWMRTSVTLRTMNRAATKGGTSTDGGVGPGLFRYRGYRRLVIQQKPKTMRGEPSVTNHEGIHQILSNALFRLTRVKEDEATIL
jgi:hypothetical protein